MVGLNLPLSMSATHTSYSVSVLTVLALLRLASRPRVINSPTIVPSPRDTLLPLLSCAEAAALPYPPDIFPGARDVDSPYGVMRVYEWGPEDGRKVVFVHGDSTPGPVLGPIARALVDKGFQVLVFGKSENCGGPRY